MCGEVNIKLLPTSTSAKRVVRWFAERQRGARLYFSGSYGDPEINFHVQLKGGLLKQCPPSVVPNKTFEVIFEFEEIIPDYDGATFAGAPVLAAG